MTMPDFPIPGQPNNGVGAPWTPWAQAVHAAATEVTEGRLTDVELRAAFDAWLEGAGGGGSTAPSLGILTAGLSSAAYAACPIVFAGDSITEGNAASTTARRWPNILTARLQAQYPSGGTATAVEASISADFTNRTGAGIHGYNAAESGLTASNYLTSGEITKVVALNPRAIFHTVGTNDFLTNVTVATYKTNLQSKIASLKAGLAQPCVHILVHLGESAHASTPVAAWTAYGQAMKDIAAADPNNVAFIDLAPSFAACGIPAGDPLDLYAADMVHPNDQGMALIAEGVAQALKVSPGSVGIGETDPVTTLAADTFARADSSSLGSTEVGSLPWATINPAKWSISGNRLVAAAGAATAPDECVIDVGASDGTFTATLAALNSSSGFAFRSLGDTGGYVFWVSDSDGKWTLTKRSGAGGYFAPDGLTTNSITAAAGDEVSIVLNGSSIVCKVNGAIAASAADAAWTGTKFGAFTVSGAGVSVEQIAVTSATS